MRGETKAADNQYDGAEYDRAYYDVSPTTYNDKKKKRECWLST